MRNYTVCEICGEPTMSYTKSVCSRGSCALAFRAVVKARKMIASARVALRAALGSDHERLANAEGDLFGVEASAAVKKRNAKREEERLAAEAAALEQKAADARFQEKMANMHLLCTCDEPSIFPGVAKCMKHGTVRMKPLPGHEADLEWNLKHQAEFE